MSLFGALNSATAGLRLIQSNVKLVSDNVTEADNPTRTRHILQKTTDATGRVQVATYTRQTDTALRIKLEESTARKGTETTRSEYLKKIGDLLGAGSGAPQLTELAQKFSDTWRELETTPESDTVQRDVIQSGDRLANEIRRVSQGVEDLDRDLQDKTQDGITELNKILKQVDNINKDIVYVHSRGEPTDDLADQRDALLQKVNELVGVRVLEREDGRVAVFTTGGLSLIDAEATQLDYNGRDIVISNAPANTVNQQMREGRLAALLEMRADGSQQTPPAPVSQRPATEIIRKLRDQLDTLANSFTLPAAEGQPAGFNEAYNAAPTLEGELQYRFFSGTDRFTIAMSEHLLTGEAKIKTGAIVAVTEAVTTSLRTFEADGLTMSETSYAGFANGIVGLWSTASKSLSETAQVATETHRLMEVRYHSEVGVNIDEEMAHLQVLQTSYSATAHVVQTINAMFDALERVVS